MASKYLNIDSFKLLHKVLPRLVEATTYRIIQACTLAIPHKVGELWMVEARSYRKYR